MADAAYGSLPFREQAEFFRRKLNLPTDGWTDLYNGEHDWSFVVAGANRDAIVADFRGAVERAIAGQSTLEDFRKDFDRIVATHGWDYNGGRNWRSRVIYDTNLSTSYAAGRWQQLQAAPYWQYEHQDWVEHPRPIHVSWNGLVLEKGDPAWEVMFPPNGWGCHCKVRGLWLRDLVRLGKSGPDQAPTFNYVERTIGQRSLNGPRTVRVPEGIDPGFEYAPGAARMRSAVPPERPGPLVPGSAGGPGVPNRGPVDPLPPPRLLPASELLPAGLDAPASVDAFLGALGVEPSAPAIVRDVIGERVVVSRDMFLDGQGALEANGRGLPLLARALLDPDEIWTRVEWLPAQERAVVRRRYVARFLVEGEPAPSLAVFEVGADGWSGITVLQDAAQAADDWRIGALLYRREAL
ncbi:hypothetical protein AVMA1855_15340 [Acidovorax sp. SUPP1855]|uniref:PBECR2 nuclease fold domain-containing protein n=1 Tax=Acidovorax sp. SUPP1855 TaxID=431774 RepID=UPI0023DE54FA|nr:PBECR2 nuclease fold domain-containing protein [Acidovorax sp. SUPP1855]GKS85542.1 hypothetical protein AVMA1855_15340 [Acidovorax sp. SUPP1855]